MDKKHIKRGLILLLLLTGTTISYKLFRELKKKEKLEKVQRKISIEFIEPLDGNLILENNQTVYTLFHPTCQFCQMDAEQFRQFNVELSNLQVLWLSYDEKDSILKFSKIYGLDTLPNMHFAHMDIEAMLTRYGNVKFPTFLAYDEKGQLIKKFVGLTKPEEILSAYQEH